MSAAVIEQLRGDLERLNNEIGEKSEAIAKRGAIGLETVDGKSELTDLTGLTKAVDQKNSDLRILMAADAAKAGSQEILDFLGGKRADAEPVYSGPSGGSKSAGQLFVEAESYGLGHKAGWNLNTPEVVAKNLLQIGATPTNGPNAGAFTEAMVRPVVDLTRPTYPSLRSYILNYTTSNERIRFPRIKTFTNNAAVVAEASATSGAGFTAAAVPESALTFEVIEAFVKDIMHFMPVTVNAMNDADRLVQIINSKLVQGLDEKVTLDIATTIKTDPGILSYTPLVGESDLDVILKMIAKIRIAQRAPTWLGINATDWYSDGLAFKKDATQRYMLISPTMDPEAVASLFGLVLNVNPAWAVGQPIVGDGRCAEIYDMQQATIQSSNSHLDWFLHEMVAVKGKWRGVTVVNDPEGFCKRA
jgi:HK97 family phage major capsid protein